jgi:hypothetical protein
MNLNQFLKKVGRGSSHYLFSNWYYLILHALGYLKSVTDFFCEVIWVNSSLSMMWHRWGRQFNSIHLFSVVRTLYHTVYHSISWQCAVYLDLFLNYGIFRETLMFSLVHSILASLTLQMFAFTDTILAYFTHWIGQHRKVPLCKAVVTALGPYLVTSWEIFERLYFDHI